MKAFLLLVLIVLGGCAAQEPAQKSSLTYDAVKKNIVKGKTSETEIVQMLGSPNIVTRSSTGDEIWTYSKQSVNQESGGFGRGLLLFGGSKAFSTTASNTFDLILTFDRNDVVRDYSVVSSQF
jgi:hypothetical protein